MLWSHEITTSSWCCQKKRGVCLNHVVSGTLNSNRDKVLLRDVSGSMTVLEVPIPEGEGLAADFVEAMLRLGLFERSNPLPGHEEASP